MADIRSYAIRRGGMKTVDSEDVGAAQEKAITEAINFCQSQGRHFLPEDTSDASSTCKALGTLLIS